MHAGETGARPQEPGANKELVKNLYRVWAETNQCVFYTEGECRTFCVVLQTITGLRSTMLIMD
jgi:hypothetical protein